MKRNRSYLIGGAVAGLLCSAVFAQTPTLSLEALKKNGVVVGPVDNLVVAPNDLIEVIIRVRDWSNTPGRLLAGYQSAINYEGYFSGSAGNVLPQAFLTTTDLNGLCSNPPGSAGVSNPTNSFITTADPGFVFAGLTAFPATDTQACDYRYAAGILGSGPASQPGVRKYCATVLLRVSADAAGTFTLTLDPDPDNGSFLRDQTLGAITPLALESLTLSAPAPISIVSSVPANNAIDGRQPHPISSPNPPAGFSSITLNMSAFAIGLQPQHFSITHEPAGGTPPTINTVTPNFFDAVLTLSGPIVPGKWTRITHLASGSSTRIGYLPSDVNGDKTSSPVDILKIIDHLNGVENYPAMRTDIDRSGATNPADILRVIDLLNGADAFIVWNGATLPP